MIFYIGFQVEFSTKASIAGNMRLLEVQQAAFNKEVAIMITITVMAVMIVITITVMTIIIYYTVLVIMMTI